MKHLNRVSFESIQFNVKNKNPYVSFMRNVVRYILSINCVNILGVNGGDWSTSLPADCQHTLHRKAQLLSINAPSNKTCNKCVIEN